MTDPGAYDDEMARIWRLSEEDVDRVLAGEIPREESLDGVVGLLQEAKAHFERPVDTPTRARDLAIMAREASRLRGGSEEPSDVRPTSTWRQILDRTRWVALRGAAATVAASLSMIGLAYAGVNLPGQAAENALEAVTGLELPNQGGDVPEQAASSVADDVRSVIENSTSTGCEFGQEVAAAASQSAEGETGPEEDPCTKADAAEAEGSSATGTEKSAVGRAKAEEASAESRATGDEAASSGQATGGEESGETSDDAGDDADDVASDGTGTASEKSGGSSDQGTTRKP